MFNESFVTLSEDESIQLGSKFAEKLSPGDVVCLFGELGSGKTQFIKGICNYFQVDEIVTSPTFTIINQYNGTFDNDDFSIFHIDLYRIKNPAELTEIGFNELLDDRHSVILIEWAEKAEGFLPENRFEIHIFLNPKNEDERVFEISKLES